MSAFGRRADFLNWARGHYGQEFAQKFQIKPPASIAEEIIQGFKTDKTTKDLIRHIATDNLADAMKKSGYSDRAYAWINGSGIAS